MTLRYNDLYLRIIIALVATHFIVTYAVPETFFQLLVMPAYYASMAGSFVIALILTWLVHFVTSKLDKKYDWRKMPAERIGLQLTFGFIMPGVTAFLLAYVYFLAYGINIFKTLYLRFDYPVILLLLFALNLYYLAYYFYLQMRIAESSVVKPLIVDTTTEEHSSAKSFLISKGAKSIPIPLEQIAYFFREGDYNFMRTINGEDFIITQSLDEAQESLPPHEYFRVNRQMLTSRKACKHFEPLPYNKLKLQTEPKHKNQLVVSQKRVKAFKEWMSNS